jgi:hypothetical protein
VTRHPTSPQTTVHFRIKIKFSRHSKCMTREILGGNCWGLGPDLQLGPHLILLQRGPCRSSPSPPLHRTLDIRFGRCVRDPAEPLGPVLYVEFCRPPRFCSCLQEPRRPLRFGSHTRELTIFMKKGQAPSWRTFMIADLDHYAREFPMLTKPTKT